MEFSRTKSEKTQNREYKTIQSKENLNTLSKSKITIQNYLGGKYFFTVDEVELNKNSVNLIENKHSKNSVLPSESDVKDGLIKMILYSNLTSVKVDGAPMKSAATLRLTSDVFIGSISSESVKEANENSFIVQICGTKQ